MKEEIKQKIKNAMVKKAIGYDAEEVVEEYQDNDEGLKLTKRKITKKHYPPDTTAARLVLDAQSENTLSSLSDEELLKEKQRLLNKLKGDKNED